MKSNTMTRRRAIASMISIGAGAFAGSLVAPIAHSADSKGASRNDAQMVARIVFEPHIPTALQRALNYAGDEGFVASMPQLLHARATAPYDNIIWNTWFTANSEENVVTTPAGNHVIVAVHGGGILTKPERIEQSYHANLSRDNSEGVTGQSAIKLSKQEAREILNGELPDGTEIPVYTFTDFKRGIADLPRRYAVTLDYNVARAATRGYEFFEVLMDEPNMIVRAGGVEQLAAYLDKYRARHRTEKMGNWHPYNRIDPNQPQTRIPFLAGNKGGIGSNEEHDYGYDEEYGLGGDASMVGMARYVAVAPRIVDSSLQYLDFDPD